MRDLLLPRGAFPGVGPERGPEQPRSGKGIVRWQSPHGSSRYVAFERGVAVSVLQVVSPDGLRGVIANVYTDPAARRRGLAQRLLARARRDFPGGVSHAEERNLSAEGRAWRSGVEKHEAGRNPERVVNMADSESLILFIDNTHALYNMKTSIEEKLLQKVARGSYDGVRARAAFSYLTEAGAKRYVKELGESEELSSSWHLAFPKTVRAEADKDLVERFWNKIQVDPHWEGKLAALKAKRGGKAGGKGRGRNLRTRTFSAEELRAMPTLSKSQADNLKVDDGKHRVWLSRMRVEDGMPYNNQVTVEENKNGTWVIVRTYRARGDRAARHEGGRNPRTSHHPRPKAGGVHKAVRYSGEVKITLSYDDAASQYNVSLSSPGKMTARVHVRPPDVLSGAVDSAASFDETARAALSLFSEEYPDIAEVAAMGESGFMVSRTKAGRWGAAGRVGLHESGRNPRTSRSEGTYKNPLIGERVELHPGTDLWMRGARYGEVVNERNGTYFIRMDNKRIRRLVKLPRDRFKKISGQYLEERPNKRMTSDEFLEQVIGQLAELGVSREAAMRHDDFIRTAWAVGHSSHSVALDIAKKEHRAARHESGKKPHISGPYEVHPSENDTEWIIVNGKTGHVRATYTSRSEALEAANQLNRTAKHESGKNPRVRRPKKRRSASPKRKKAPRRKRAARPGPERSIGPSLAERMRRAMSR